MSERATRPLLVSASGRPLAEFWAALRWALRSWLRPADTPAHWEQDTATTRQTTRPAKPKNVRPG